MSRRLVSLIASAIILSIAASAGGAPAFGEVTKHALQTNFLYQSPRVMACSLTPADESTFFVRKNKQSRPYSSLGRQKHFFAFVSFEDFSPDEPPSQVMDVVNSHAPQYFRQNSYGKLRITNSYNPQWIKLPIKSTTLNWLKGENTYEAHLEAIGIALRSVDPFFDLSEFTGFHVIFGADPLKFKGGTAAWISNGSAELVADRKVFSRVSTYSLGGLNNWGNYAGQIVTHEMGHTFGLPDLYSYSGNTGDYESVHRFVGDFDIMGFLAGNNPAMFSWNRWRLGWLSSKQVACVRPGVERTFKLDPLNKSNSKNRKLIVVNIKPQLKLVIEYRPLGTDTLQEREGLLLYYISDKPGGRGGIEVYSPSGDIEKGDSIIELGQRVCVSGVCILGRTSHSTAAIVSVVS